MWRTATNMAITMSLIAFYMAILRQSHDVLGSNTNEIKLVGGLKHFLFSKIYGIIMDNPCHWRTHIFFKMGTLHHQAVFVLPTPQDAQKLSTTASWRSHLWQVDGSCRCQEPGIRYWRPRGWVGHSEPLPNDRFLVLCCFQSVTHYKNGSHMIPWMIPMIDPDETCRSSPWFPSARWTFNGRRWIPSWSRAECCCMLTLPWITKRWRCRSSWAMERCAVTVQRCGNLAFGSEIPGKGRKIYI